MRMILVITVALLLKVSNYPAIGQEILQEKLETPAPIPGQVVVREVLAGTIQGVTR